MRLSLEKPNYLRRTQGVTVKRRPQWLPHGKHTSIRLLRRAAMRVHISAFESRESSHVLYEESSNAHQSALVIAVEPRKPHAIPEWLRLGFDFLAILRT
jgi:hypothetical protein